MTDVDDRPVVIAVAPHKASWTVTAVSAMPLQPVATIRVAVSLDGYRELRRFRKNDDADAVSIAIAAHTAPHLQSVRRAPAAL